VIQIAAKLIAVGDAKVVNPTSNVLTGSKVLAPHTTTPVAVGELPYPLLELKQSFRVPLDASIYEGESQELTLAGLHHLAFLCVDHKLQAVLQVLSDAVQNTFSRTLSLHQNDEVVGISY